MPPIRCVTDGVCQERPFLCPFPIKQLPDTYFLYCICFIIVYYIALLSNFELGFTQLRHIYDFNLNVISIIC